jgi:signal transduction histidine kinase
MSQLKILIVEDEAIVAEDIGIRLEKMGYAIADIVASGEEAISAAIRTQPDLVLMDIMLQNEMSGIQAAQEIYTQLHKPVIYLTAYGDDKTVKQAQVTYPFGYLLKPFKDKELMAAIEIARSRYQKEQEMKQALNWAESEKAKAQEENEQKSEYLRLASHDLRSPITNIKAWAQLFYLSSEKWSEEKKYNALKEIEKAADRMNILLEDILIMARTENPDNNFQPRMLNFLSLCQNFMDKIQYRAGNNYTIKFEYQGEYTNACVDEQLCWHLLNNLLDNALKYSPKGSEISLMFIGEPDNICLEVKDSGVGIPAKDQKKLFQLFHRGSNVMDIPGNGLGLAIVKRVVDLHNGTIEVISQENQGTTVMVKFPVNLSSGVSC